MKLYLIHLTLFFFAKQFTCITSAQLTKLDIDKSIDFNSLKHPYLYFSEKDKPELLSRIQIAINK